MYIVQHKSGKYFKRGNIRSRWDDSLVEKDKATIFRSTSGILNCLGTWMKLDKPIQRGKYRKQYGKMILDETRWTVIPVELKET